MTTILTVAGYDLQSEEVSAIAMSPMVIQRHARRRTLDVCRWP